ETCRDESLQLLVQAEPGKHRHAGWGIGPGKEWNARFVHGFNDLEFFLDEASASKKVVSIVVHDLVREALPGDIFPVGWNVLGERIVRSVVQLQQISAAFPDQRGALPRLVLRQQRKQRFSAFGIVGRQKFALALPAFEELIFEW